MFLIKYRVRYKSGHINTRTKLVNEPTKDMAWSAIKHYEYENYAVEDIESLSIVKHIPQK